MSNSNLPNIGSILKSIRLNRNLNLDETASLTGVSKAMLGQIERGESNPTISTLWKISTGLKITFSALLHEPAGDYAPVELAHITPILEASGLMRLYNVFPFDPVTGFEYFHIELEPGCDYTSPSHANVLEEYIVVTEGCLEMSIGGTTYMLTKGTSIKFKGYENHSYKNPTADKTIFQNIMKY